LGFNGFQGGPQLRVQLGDIVRIRLTNAGGLPHEFVIVLDKDAAIFTMRDVIARLHQEGLEGDAFLAAFDRGHDTFLGRLTPIPGTHIQVGPGQTRVVEFQASQQGTFWYVCLEGAGTLPEQVHAERGMFAQFIVEP
jgi:FtsP/CotA-like multicopper oxidase with cupredoxin domain